MRQYISILDKLPNGQYVGFFPDFPNSGFVCDGSQENQALTCLKALRKHAKLFLKGNNDLPIPAEIEELEKQYKINYVASLDLVLKKNISKKHMFFILTLDKFKIINRNSRIIRSAARMMENQSFIPVIEENEEDCVITIQKPARFRI